MCRSRNLGLLAAKGELQTYLDDDNWIEPTFVAEAIAFFKDNPSCFYSMTRQYRRRDVVKDGQTIRQGKPFISPDIGTSIESLLLQKSLFDSNGFVHRLCSFQWNPNYRIFADYEFLLQCVNRWGCTAFKLNPQILVNYIQKSTGVVGRSNYGEWASELEAICVNQDQYGSSVANLITEVLASQANKYYILQNNGVKISGFAQKLC